MEQSTYYHVYNHANGDENLYRQDENYHFFLRQWAKYIEPVADTYCYCLMPNHFHFLIRTKSELELATANLTGLEDLSGFISKSFSNLFNAYAKAYNEMYGRRGSLFHRPFKKKEISSDPYLTAVITYIHRNPIHHGFCDDLTVWPYSSYMALLSEKKTKLQRQQVLDWFGDRQSFIDNHRKEITLPDKSLFIDF